MSSSATTSAPADLRAAIEAAGLTQRDLARAIGVEEASVSRWCNGLRIPDRHAARIAEALRARKGER